MEAEARQGSSVPPSSQEPPLSNEGEVIAEVQRAMRGIEYGSVLIKIHQGEVVGIETSTKVRLKNT